jgi:hypothetical protein
MAIKNKFEKKTIITTKNANKQRMKLNELQITKKQKIQLNLNK